MKDEINLFDVRAAAGKVPNHGIPTGAKAAVIGVEGSPPLASEIEVVDASGMTLWWGSVECDQIELEPNAEA